MQCRLFANRAARGHYRLGGNQAAEQTPLPVSRIAEPEVAVEFFEFKSPLQIREIVLRRPLERQSFGFIR